MMTPQEVANCTFAKAVMGGYNMASVDDFLDKLTEDYSALFKENAALKAKLKKTVDEVAKYRESEGTICSTLLAAQKSATAIVAEAEQRREAMIEEASREAKARLAQLEQEVAGEERRLEQARVQVDRELEQERRRLSVGQETLRKFIRDVTAVCNEQLAALELLPELPPEPEVPPAPVLPVLPVQEAPEEEAAEPSEQPEEAAETPGTGEELGRNLNSVLSAFAAAGPQEEEPAAGQETGDPFAEDNAGEKDEDLEATRVINLDDLQFGRNYTRG